MEHLESKVHECEGLLASKMIHRIIITGDTAMLLVQGQGWGKPAIKITHCPFCGERLKLKTGFRIGGKSYWHETNSKGLYDVYEVGGTYIAFDVTWEWADKMVKWLNKEGLNEY